MKKTLALLMVLLAVPAFAQTEQEKKKVQNVTFDQGSDVTGTTVGPVGEYYGIPKRPDFKRLIKVRMNFDDKLRESVHEM